MTSKHMGVFVKNKNMSEDFKGATIWARQTIESDIFFWKPDKWFKIWFFIVSKANHKDTKQFKRGECFLTGEGIQDATGATPDQVKKCLSWLRKNKMIATKRSTRGFILSINKYSTYQDFEHYTSTNSSTREAPEKHQRSTTINNNEKNERMKEYTSAKNDWRVEAFDKLWTTYNKKVGRQQAFKAFQKITRDEFGRIMAHVPEYVRLTPDKAYRKHLATYLNGRAWEDELIQKSPEQRMMHSKYQPISGAGSIIKSFRDV